MLLFPAIMAAPNIRHSERNIKPLPILPPWSFLIWHSRRRGTYYRHNRRALQVRQVFYDITIEPLRLLSCWYRLPPATTISQVGRTERRLRSCPIISETTQSISYLAAPCSHSWLLCYRAVAKAFP